MPGPSILVGTPSGITLAPEGGAHQSVITPGIGIGQPGCTAWEPAFGQDFEWAFLHALSQLGKPAGSSSYFRLSTRPIDQELANVPTNPEDRAKRREQVLRGGYRLVEASDQGLEARVVLVATGAVMPEALEAAAILNSMAGSVLTSSVSPAPTCSSVHSWPAGP